MRLLPCQNMLDMIIFCLLTESTSFFQARVHLCCRFSCNVKTIIETEEHKNDDKT
jgi:hypothetical protein